MNSPYSWDKKVQAVTSYLVLGDMSLVAALIKIPHQTVRLWKTKDWWKEVEGTIREQNNIQTNAKLKKIVDKSLDTVMDRLEEGDFQYDPKTGRFVRKPVLLRDAAKAAEVMMHRQDLMNQIQIQKLAVPTVDEALKRIAAEFIKIARGEVDVKSEAAVTTELSEGIRQLSGEASPDQATSTEESSAREDGADLGEDDLDGRGSPEGTEQGWHEFLNQPAVANLDGEPFVPANQESKT